MGEGISFTCKHCGKENCALWGIGMIFPLSYQETIQQVKNVECGAEYKELAESFPLFAVNSEKYVFTCDRCNTWRCDKDMSLYVPNNIEKYKRKKIDEMYWPYYETEDSLEQDYRLVKKVNHRCDKCKRPMRRMSHDEAMNRLSTGWCGYCGAVNNTEDISHVMWD